MNTKTEVKQRRAQPGVALWRWVRAIHRFIVRISLRDMGVAFALVMIGKICAADGNLLHALWCDFLGVAIYITAPRPNAADEQRRGKDSA